MFNVILSNNLDEHKALSDWEGFLAILPTTLYCVIVKLQLPT